MPNWFPSRPQFLPPGRYELDHSQPLARGLELALFGSHLPGGGRWVDLSRRGNHGVLNGNPRWGGAARGVAVIMDGTGDYVSVANSASLNFGSGNYTLVARLATTGASRVGIMSHVTQAGQKGYYIDMLATGIVRAAFQTAAQDYRVRDSAAAINNGAIRSVSVVRTGTTSFPDVYLDGALSNGSTLTSGTPGDTDFSTPPVVRG